MKEIQINEIIGNEILVKPVFSDQGIMLVEKGMIVRKSNAIIFKELGIKSIFVEDEPASEVEYSEILQEETKNDCKKMLTDIVKMQTNHNQQEEEDLVYEVAQELIDDILSQDDILINVSEMRNRDDSIFSHCVAVAGLTVYVSLKMGISNGVAREFTVGALLHDIGMNFIPSQYRNKSLKELNRKEISVIKKHVDYGYELLMEKDVVSDISLEIIKNHHERVNGSGYPNQIKGKEIDLGSRIVSVCDTFDAMIYDGNRDMKVYEVVEYIQSNSNILFDEKVVSHFLDCIALYPTGSKIITNEGQVGVVIKQNKGFPARPIIAVKTDKNGQEMVLPVKMDLMKIFHIFIVEVIA